MHCTRSPNFLGQCVQRATHIFRSRWILTRVSTSPSYVQLPGPVPIDPVDFPQKGLGSCIFQILLCLDPVKELPDSPQELAGEFPVDIPW